jgi:hypothetical protein
LLPKATVQSDGLDCIAAVAKADCVHTPEVVKTPKPRDLPEFKWINTVLGKLKTTPTVAYKVLKFRKYAQIYLAAFTYRFNHRFVLRDWIATLTVYVAQARLIPKKRRSCGHAEEGFYSGCTSIYFRVSFLLHENTKYVFIIFR